MRFSKKCLDELPELAVPGRFSSLEEIIRALDQLLDVVWVASPPHIGMLPRVLDVEALRVRVEDQTPPILIVLDRAFGGSLKLADE